MIKIAFIGAGSIVFAKNLLVDILSFEELNESIISLMDINTTRLGLISNLAKTIIAQQGFKAIIEAGTDRKETLKDANYVILMMQVGGLDAYEQDIIIPQKYGIPQIVGDTIGPGGVFRGLRTAPILLDICREMQELCPDALLINYVNPMAINCWVLNKTGNIKNVGLCHSIQETSKDIARYIEVPYDEVSYRCAGINHMAWFLEYKWNGKDAYPLLFKKYYDEELYNQDLTKFELLKYYGFFVTESSYHISEYVPYFLNKEEWIKRIKNIESWLKIDLGSYLNRCKRLDKTFNEDMNRIINKAEVRRTHEYGAFIIHAMETGQPTVIHGNVENKGQITNLPLGCCVEIPCFVDAKGIQPMFIGDLPIQLAALNRTNVNVQELAVEGALTGRKDAVYQAIMMDPLTSAVLALPVIHSMVTEMFEAEKPWLPQFK